MRISKFHGLASDMVRFAMTSYPPGSCIFLVCFVALHATDTVGVERSF